MIIKLCGVALSWARLTLKKFRA